MGNDSSVNNKTTIPTELYFEMKDDTRKLVQSCQTSPQDRIDGFVPFGNNEIYVSSCADLNTEIARMTHNASEDGVEWESYFQELCIAKPDASFSFMFRERSQYEGQTTGFQTAKSCTELDNMFKIDSGEDPLTLGAAHTDVDANIFSNLKNLFMDALLRVIADD